MSADRDEALVRSDEVWLIYHRAINRLIRDRKKLNSIGECDHADVFHKVLNELADAEAYLSVRFGRARS